MIIQERTARRFLATDSAEIPVNADVDALLDDLLVADLESEIVELEDMEFDDMELEEMEVV